MSAHDNHGHSPAAWTAVILAIIGFTVGGLGVVLALPWVFLVGSAVVLLAAVVGKVLQVMGLGATAAAEPAAD
jgi:hypothetical protein